MPPTQADWQIRRRVYEALATSGHAPTAHSLAHHFNISAGEAQEALRRLHDAHALVLREGSGDILMAHPFSAVATDYRVTVGDAVVYANCAWDSLGIPAMLGADALVQARHPLNGDLVSYAVENGNLMGSRGKIAHFALPFRQWYDDIVDT